ncbi:hypothetical protein BJ912DRAFT_1094781 [Pholiota molesta]|nr:hypothetical protein BJ912DRAFT_1094781 [Pholiota molesta]
MWVLTWQICLGAGGWTGLADRTALDNFCLPSATRFPAVFTVSFALEALLSLEFGIGRRGFRARLDVALNESVDPREVLPVNIVHGTHGQLVVFGAEYVAVAFWAPSTTRHRALAAREAPCDVREFMCGIHYYWDIVESSGICEETTGPEPGRMLCLLQASLLYGMPALASTAALSLVLQMFFMIKAAYDGIEYLDRDHIIRVWFFYLSNGSMIDVGWALHGFFISMISTAVVGAANPSKVSRSRRFFYCSVDSPALTDTLTIFSAVVLLTATVLIGWTVLLLGRRILLARKHAPRPRWTVDLNFPFRIMGFGIYVIISLSLSLLSIETPSSPVPDLIIASAATVAILIFGTQSDILRALCFWKSPKPHEVRESLDVDLKNEFGGGDSETNSRAHSIDHNGMEKPLPAPPPSANDTNIYFTLAIRQPRIDCVEASLNSLLNFCFELSVKYHVNLEANRKRGHGDERQAEVEVGGEGAGQQGTTESQISTELTKSEVALLFWSWLLVVLLLSAPLRAPLLLSAARGQPFAESQPPPRQSQHPHPHLPAAAADPKITRIASDLVTLLKTRLNITEVAMPAAAAAAPAQAAAPADDEPAAVRAVFLGFLPGSFLVLMFARLAWFVCAGEAKEKTVFNVKLESFDPASKAKIIREVKARVPNLGS